MSDPGYVVRLWCMKARQKHNKRLTRFRDRRMTHFRREERAYADERARLEAIGEANKWLWLSEQTRKVALVLSHWDPRFSGKEWTAVLYREGAVEAQARRSPTRPEWSGKRWRTALTTAVTELLADEVLDRWLHRGIPRWFQFERLDGTVLPY